MLTGSVFENNLAGALTVLQEVVSEGGSLTAVKGSYLLF